MSGEIEDERFYVLLTVFLFAVVVGTIFSLLALNEDNLAEVDRIELGENTVSLYSGCYRLDMVVSNEQVQNIQASRVSTDRPMTFDFFSSAINDLGGDFDRVEIHGIEDNAYLADTVFQKFFFWDRRVDSRPSDAIALAQTSEEDIFIERELLVSQAEYYCSTSDLALI